VVELLTWRDMQLEFARLRKELEEAKEAIRHLKARSDLSSRVPIHTNNAERDTAFPNPVNGNMCYNTAAGVIEGYENGAWVNL
jgi:hypothetical protein